MNSQSQWTSATLSTSLGSVFGVWEESELLSDCDRMDVQSKGVQYERFSSRRYCLFVSSCAVYWEVYQSWA